MSSTSSACLTERARRRAALLQANRDLRERLAAAEATLQAVRAGAGQGATGRDRERSRSAAGGQNETAAPPDVEYHEVSFADVLHSQGRGRRGTLDLSRMCVREVAEVCRGHLRGDAAAGGVRWVVQARRCVAEGAALAVSSTLETPACSASLLLLWLSVQLECGLLVCVSTFLCTCCACSAPSVFPCCFHATSLTPVASVQIYCMNLLCLL